MVEANREALVLLDATAYERPLESLRRLAAVTQVLAPRLALVRIDPGQSEALAGIQGVVGVYTREGPDPQTLTPIERRFVEAWRSRARAKQRVGDQADWDAPGFIAPDDGGPGGKGKD